MSDTYTDLELTNFPDEVDTIAEKVDPASSGDLTLMNTYKGYIDDGDYTSAVAYLVAHPTLLDMMTTADDFNKLLQMILAIERYYLSLANQNNLDTSDLQFPSDSKTVTQFRTDIETSVGLKALDLLATYSKAGSQSAIANGDTIKQALGKLEKKADDSLSDISTHASSGSAHSALDVLHISDAITAGEAKVVNVYLYSGSDPTIDETMPDGTLFIKYVP